MTFQKGNLSWNKGLTKKTDERLKKAGEKRRQAFNRLGARKKHREAIKMAMAKPEVRKKVILHGLKFRGRIVSEETRKKISKANKGRKQNLSKEQRKKISERMKGKNNPLNKLGVREKHHKNLLKVMKKPEIRKKMSLAIHNAMTPKVRKKISIGVSKAMTPERRKKMSERWQNPKFREMVIKKIRKRMLNGGAVIANAGIKNPSKPQVKLYRFLKKFYPNAKLNFPIKIRGSSWYSLDVAIPELKIDFEFDGEYWHKNRKTEDFFRDENLIERGWCVTRIKGEKELELILNG